MKKIIGLISATLLGILLATTGCKTTGSSSSSLTQEQKVEKAAVLLKGTVRSALILVLDKNGTNARPYITVARDTLSGFVGGTNFAPDALLTAIAGLPSDALSRPEVALAISTIVTAYEIYYGDYVRDQVSGNVNAVKLLTAIRDGCDEALRLGP